MKTTIEINDALLQDAHRVARQQSTTVRALVEQGLRKVLAEQRKCPPFKLRDASVDGRGLLPGAEGLSWAALRDLAYRRGQEF